MKKVAEDVYLLDGFPSNAINVYLIGDVLLDAATRWATRRILRQLKDRTVTAHALTHAHPDHQGASHAICQALDIPFWCGEVEKYAAESGDLSGVMSPGVIGRLGRSFMGGPGHPIQKTLKDGDEVAGFKILDTPGHSPGHLSYWRESDRLLIAGDVLFNVNVVTGLPGLHAPPDSFSVDPALNRDSARKLALLNPATVCFGHGPVVTEGRKVVEFVNALI